MRGSIVRRGRRHAIVLYLGRDPKTGKKKQRWVSGHRTEREAEAHLPQLLLQVQAAGSIPSARLQTGEFFRQWLRDYAGGAVSETTLARYGSIVRLHIEPTIGHTALSRLTGQAIQGMVTRMLERGLSGASALYCYRVVHEALKHAVRWGLLTVNPADFVDPPRKKHSEMRTWDEEQARLFLAQAKRSTDYYALYLMGALTGMRQGELLGLRWRDLDLTLGTASVCQTFYRLGTRQIFKEPKSQMSRRVVALPPVLVDELKRLREQQKELRRTLGSEYEDHDLVFCQPTGKPLHAQNIVRRDFQRVIKQAGLPRIRFHDLRHTHAAVLLRNGVNAKVIQERLGHSSPAFTLAVYGHVLPGMQEEAARLAAEMLLGDKSAGRGLATD